MRKRELKNMEWGLVIVAIILTIIGLVALFSATQETEYDEFKKQIIWFVVSIVAMILTMLINYETLVKISPVLYGIFLILLVAVMFTKPVNGATSWFNIGIFSFQPSEFAKIAVILFLSLIISKIQERYADEINKPTRLLIIFAALAVPLLLIIKQPDYGTAIAYIISLVLMLYVSGIDKKYIIISFAILLITVPLMYFFILPEHAKARIDVYLNPNIDPRGAGYNIIQSKIAIGAGKLFGMGWLKGTQTHLGFLYPKTTDFIFSMIGEELGFVVCSLIIVIYVILITKAINVAKTARDDLGSYIAMGIVRNIFISCSREHRNDNRPFAYNRSTITIY